MIRQAASSAGRSSLHRRVGRERPSRSAPSSATENARWPDAAATSATAAKSNQPGPARSSASQDDASARDWQTITYEYDDGSRLEKTNVTVTDNSGTDSTQTTLCAAWYMELYGAGYPAEQLKPELDTMIEFLLRALRYRPER